MPKIIDTEYDLDAMSAELDAELDALAGGGDDDDGAAAHAELDTGLNDDDAEDASAEAAGETDPEAPEKDPGEQKQPEEQPKDAKADEAEAKKSRFQRRQEEIQEKLRQVKTEQEQIAVERQQLQETVKQVQATQQVIGNYYATLQKQVPGLVALKPGERLRDEHGRTAQDYADFAKELERRGDDDRAGIAREFAAKLEAQEKLQVNLRSLDEARVKMFHHEQAEYWRRAHKEIPEIAAEGQNEFKVALKSFLEKEPWVFQTLGGPLLAARLVKAQMQQQDSTATAEENARLKARVAELEKRVAHVPAGGNAPKSKGAAKRWDDLTLEEQEAQLDREFSSSRR